MVKGHELRSIQKRLRLKDAEVCAEAEISMGTLFRVFGEHPRVTEASVNKVAKAIEILRRRLANEINCKTG